MKVTLSPGDLSYSVSHKAICELGKAVVEVRQSADGHAMIIVICDANVSMEPRAAGIWLVVKETDSR